MPWLASGLCAAGLPLLGLGCAQQSVSLLPSEPPVVARAAAPEPADNPATSAAAPEKKEALGISLDMVLRLACDQNTQIALAREKVREAGAEQCVADLAWLPDIYLGTAYWRHEGGIQNEDGTLTRSSTGALFAGTEINARLDPKEAAFQKVNAARQIWQRRGELSRITSKTLLEAATTYIDLLQARTSEAIAQQLEKLEQGLLERARKNAKGEPRASIQALQAEAIEAESRGHHQALVKLREQGDAAAVKLANLLGLDPNVKLMPIDDRLAAFALADTTASVEDQVSRALSNGPGVRELESLLAVVQDSIEKAKGPGMLLPIFEVRMAEGGFGAGPGDSMLWANRWDLCAQMRWNLTDLCKARDRQHVAESKLQQLYLTHQDLRNKLTAGVHEARSAITSGEEQIRLVAQQIGFANRAYQLSDERMNNPPLEKSERTTEVQVLQALRALELSHLRYLESVSAYDKAQLRLLVLTGTTSCDSPPLGVQPSSLPKPTEPAQMPAAPSGTKAK
jgi:outer membrane protein TolC